MKIASAQMACKVGDVNANLRKIRNFAERAKSNGVDWIVFPEMSDTGYSMKVIRELAAPWTENFVPQLQLLAKECALGLICGVSERDGGRIFNSQVVISAQGRIVGKYRKTHLFAPAPVEEHKCFAAGTELVTVPMGDARAGLSICYDLRFPEIYRVLALDGRADTFIISSAWPAVRRQHLRALAAARAIENQSYLILANRVGKDEGVSFSGNSSIIDPSGAILTEASNDDEELIEAEISSLRLALVRERMPVFSHRRPELYKTESDSASPQDRRLNIAREVINKTSNVIR